MMLEGQDFYYENGFMVLTEAFLLKRGRCCKGGCRHCPYGFSTKEKESHSIKNENYGGDHVRNNQKSCEKVGKQTN